MIKLGGFLGILRGPLLKTALPLMKNVIKPLARSVLIPLGLTAAASTGRHKCQDLVIIQHISNDQMEDIIKIS